MIKMQGDNWKWALPLIAISVVLDQISKAIVLAAPVFKGPQCLQPGATERCGGIELPLSFLDWSMVWNYGVSYGMFQSDGIGRWLLLLLSFVIAIAFTVWIFRTDRFRTALALALVVGGAVGNMIDRARFGAVVDFVDMSGPWFGITFPAEGGFTKFLDERFFVPDGVLGLGFPYVYNVADMSITFGALLLLTDQLLAEREEKG